MFFAKNKFFKVFFKAISLKKLSIPLMISYKNYLNITFSHKKFYLNIKETSLCKNLEEINLISQQLTKN